MDAIHSKWRKLRPPCKSKARRAQLKKLHIANKERMCKKASTTANIVDNSVGEHSSVTRNTGEFLLIHTSFFDSVLQVIQCPQCLMKCVSAEITERHGLCAKVKVLCRNCGYILSEQYSSPRLESSTKNAAFSINRLAVDAAVNIGIGNASLEKFCANLNLKPMSVRTFHQHQKIIYEEAVSLEEKVLSAARCEVRKAYINQDISLADRKIINIACSYDGTWHKRGHTSMYGVGVAIDILTGLVIDFEVLSKFCHLCASASSFMNKESSEFMNWEEQHQKSGDCMKNFSGPSGNMEVAAAENIWSRSEKKHSLRYTTILSDGDARSWTRLNTLQPYGPSIQIEKEECVNHIHKRMGKGLRDAAQRFSLGGRKEGALTACKIEYLTKYYRRAVVANCGDIEATQRAIKATLFHCSSTDSKPQHHLCPEGVESWCFYNKAVASNTLPSSHKNMRLRLSENVLQCLLPLYERLSESELLKRCSRGATQNSNESLHSLIWRRCSKEIFVSKHRIYLAVVHAVMERNLGILKSQNLKNSLRDITMSSVTEEVCCKLDEKRRKRKIHQDVYRHSRRLRKLDSAKKKDQKQSKDYSSGAF